MLRGPLVARLAGCFNGLWWRREDLWYACGLFSWRIWGSMNTFQNPRAYLQQRVKLFAGVAGFLFTAGLLFDLAVPAEGQPLVTGTRVALLGVAASSSLAWLYLRGAARPLSHARAADVLVTLAAIAAFAPQPLLTDMSDVSNILALWGPIPMAVGCMLRAALIPSPTWLTVALSALWSAAMTTCAVYGWDSGDMFLMGRESDNLPLQYNLAAGLGMTLVAGVVSQVVYGLQAQVRQAMQLGQYTLESKLGEGGMGVVYLARHALLRRPTAVKLLPAEKSSEQAITRFEREVQQTCRLTHPNTVAIFDYGRTEDGVFYYAMEYLDGISLEDLVAQYGPLPQGRVIYLLLQVAEALSEAHQLGLVHRDIKPDNLMLCERGGLADTVKVLDFGLVRELDADPASRDTGQAIQGTPLYMAPEALLRPLEVDARVDLYALGAVAYFLLTGEVLFGGSVTEVLAHHLQTPPTPPSQRLGAPLDPRLEEVVLRLLAKDPEHRYASARDLARALATSPMADTWDRTEASLWWKAQRARIQNLRQGRSEPVHDTIGLALTESVVEATL